MSHKSKNIYQRVCICASKLYGCVVIRYKIRYKFVIRKRLNLSKELNFIFVRRALYCESYYARNRFYVFCIHLV